MQSHVFVRCSEPNYQWQNHRPKSHWTSVVYNQLYDPLLHHCCDQRADRCTLCSSPQCTQRLSLMFSRTGGAEAEENWSELVCAFEIWIPLHLVTTTPFLFHVFVACVKSNLSLWWIHEYEAGCQRTKDRHQNCDIQKISMTNISGSESI